MSVVGVRRSAASLRFLDRTVNHSIAHKRTFVEHSIHMNVKKNLYNVVAYHIFHKKIDKL